MLTTTTTTTAQILLGRGGGAHTHTLCWFLMMCFVWLPGGRDRETTFPVCWDACTFFPFWGATDLKPGQQWGSPHTHTTHRRVDELSKVKNYVENCLSMQERSCVLFARRQPFSFLFAAAALALVTALWWWWCCCCAALLLLLLADVVVSTYVFVCVCVVGRCCCCGCKQWRRRRRLNTASARLLQTVDFLRRR